MRDLLGAGRRGTRNARQNILHSLKAGLRRPTAAWLYEVVVTTDVAPRFQFDVALSFAGEDREYVDGIADRLRTADLVATLDIATTTPVEV